MIRKSRLYACSLLVASSICLLSCESDTKEGGLTPIGIEKKEFSLENSASSITVQTKEKGWGLYSVEEIKDNDKVLHKKENPSVIICPDTIAGEWFDVIKEENTKLVVKVAKNETGKERKIVISLAGVSLMTENVTLSQK